MASIGLGKCGLCHRQIDEMTPINSVMLGRPSRAYLVHADCKSQEPDHLTYTVDGRGQFEPPHPAPQPSDEVKIVTSLGDFMPEIARTELPDPTPSMPVKEQRGRPAKKASPKTTTMKAGNQ